MRGKKKKMTIIFFSLRACLNLPTFEQIFHVFFVTDAHLSNLFYEMLRGLKQWRM